MKNFLILVLMWLVVACGDAQQAASNGGVSSGKAGSRARFALVGDRLYTLAADQLLTFSVEDAGSPIPLTRTSIPWDAETIFPHGQNLYIGASSGLYIYELSNIDAPQLEGSHSHEWACDPVVVQETFAFVTLQAGNRCGAGRNLLQVYDVSQPAVPALIQEIPMFAPTGLAVDGKRLFVCDDSAGLKDFDISEPAKPRLVDSLVGQRCNDLITREGLLIATSSTGIFQYSYQQGSLELLSVLPWDEGLTK